MDISPLAVRVSRLRGLKKAKVMSISEIGSFKPSSFDTVLMLGNNFGLFGSFNKARLLLHKLSRITSPSALVIAESNDPSGRRIPFTSSIKRLTEEEEECLVN